jgi:uncharacterized protein with HEPN domain
VPPRRWRTRAEDILEALARIQRYTAGLTEEEFLRDDLVVDAVIRNLAVVGEAVRGIPEDVRSRHPSVPWERLRGMRNVLIHEYFDVGQEILWGTVRDDVPMLAARVRALLEQESG